MKTKNVKVRSKDIKQGVTIFEAHPIFGISRLTVQSKPRPYYSVLDKRIIGFKFDHTTHFEDGHSYETDSYLSDMGIELRTRCKVYRRAFKKLKHAEHWVKSMSTDPTFKKHWAEHLENMKEWDAMDSYFDDSYFDDMQEDVDSEHLPVIIGTHPTNEVPRLCTTLMHRVMPPIIAMTRINL